MNAREETARVVAFEAPLTVSSVLAASTGAATPADAHSPTMADEMVSAPEAGDEAQLLSPQVMAQAGAAFAELNRPSAPPMPPALPLGSRTLDEVVVEALRPMLRDWLDQNLPPLVERLVRAEIERIARGGR